MKQYDIRLAKVPQPPKDCTGEPVMLTDATIQERLDKVLRGMKSRGFEQLVVYGDAEHCGNFQYLMGYLKSLCWFWTPTARLTLCWAMRI